MRSCMNEVSQESRDFFSKSGMINMYSKYQGLLGLAMGITLSPNYKPRLDQARSDIFPNREKTCTNTSKSVKNKTSFFSRT